MNDVTESVLVYNFPHYYIFPHCIVNHTIHHIHQICIIIFTMYFSQRKYEPQISRFNNPPEYNRSLEHLLLKPQSFFLL